MGKGKMRLTPRWFWEKDWFLELDAYGQLAYLYLWFNCSEAGIWSISKRRLKTDCHIESDFKSIITGINAEKVRVMLIDDNQSLFLTEFIEYQNRSKEEQICYLPPTHQARGAIIKELRGYAETSQWLDFKVENGDIVIGENQDKKNGSSRQRITSNTRGLIQELDRHTCQYCGFEGDNFSLTVDHVIARELGGDNSNNNLVTACHSCNKKKGLKNPIEFIRQEGFVPLERLSKILLTLNNNTIKGSETLDNKTLIEGSEGYRDKDKETEQESPRSNNSITSKKNIKKSPSDTETRGRKQKLYSYDEVKSIHFNEKVDLTMADFKDLEDERDKKGKPLWIRKPKENDK